MNSRVTEFIFNRHENIVVIKYDVLTVEFNVYRAEKSFNLLKFMRAILKNEAATLVYDTHRSIKEMAYENDILVVYLGNYNGDGLLTMQCALPIGERGAIKQTYDSIKRYLRASI